MWIFQDNFDPPGAEFETWEPSDWTNRPKFIEKIKDADFRQWAIDLNAFWKELGRKMIPDVEVNSRLDSHGDD